MTVADARELFAYNAWANRKFFAALAALPAEPYFRDLESSHGGIHGTLCHLVWADARSGRCFATPSTTPRTIADSWSPCCARWARRHRAPG